MIRLTPRHVKSDRSLHDLMQCMPGVHFMAHRFVICFVDFPASRDKDARRRTCNMLNTEARGALPVCEKLEDVIQVRSHVTLAVASLYSLAALY